jgi:hypothetical protein
LPKVGPATDVIPSHAIITIIAIQSGFRPLTVPDDLFFFTMAIKPFDLIWLKSHNLPAMQFCSHQWRE